MYSKDNATGAAQWQIGLEEMSKKIDTLVNVQAEMMKEIKILKNKFQELINVSSHRDQRNVEKLDSIVESVVTKIADPVYFPVNTMDELEELNTRLKTKNKMFVDQLVIRIEL